MEVEEIQSCKFPRIGSSNGRISDFHIKLGQKGEEDQFPIHDDQEDGEVVKRNGGGGTGGGNEITGGGLGPLRGWQTSRIVRVSRASGGKDRHSKVWTSKGLRDRRVRLSVTTAIQFYDLQDRLGVDQPSKAVEWLLKAASSSIAELPEINTSFPDTPRQISDEKNSSADAPEMDGDLNFQQNQNQNQNPHGSLSKSGCSSNSETSKGSGLSLSRSENRIKARERARERAAEKDKKEKENEPALNPISQSSFTELLSGATNETAQQQNHGSNGEQNLFQKPTRQWSASSMDYFAPTGLLGQSSSSTSRNHQSGFSGPMHLGQNSSYTTVVAGGGGDYHPELQPFSFVPDHLAAGGNDNYNLNFTISPSSGLAGFTRGTLQSNTQQPSSLLPHLQRFTSTTTTTTTTTDGSSNVNVPFFTVENHHHLHHQLPPGLQLFNGYGSARPSDHKGKGKN